MKILLSILCLIGSFLFGGGTSEKSSNAKPLVLSTGKRISLPKRGLTLQPPVGWEVHRNIRGASLLLQVAKQPDLDYQRTIQVLAFEGPRFIDSTTEKEFAKVIIDRNSRAPGVSGYRLQNSESIELEDGSSGLLFYTEFKVENTPLMQLHVLISSESRHFVLTYTDLAEHFTDDRESHLDTAYRSIISARLKSQAPYRFQVPVMIFSIIIVVFGLGLLYKLISHYKLSKRLKMEMVVQDGDGLTTQDPKSLPEDSLEGESGLSEESKIGSSVNGRW